MVHDIGGLVFVFGKPDNVNLSVDQLDRLCPSFKESMGAGSGIHLQGVTKEVRAIKLTTSDMHFWP